VSKLWLKYFEVARTLMRSRWAYLWDQLLSTAFLAVIMFVFVQLWKATFAATGGGSMNGYSLPEMIWYLVATESLVTSLPRIHSTLQAEVKDGDLAIRLNKPYSYLLFHYSAYVGEGLFSLGLKLVTGGLTAYLLVGGFAFRWTMVPALVAIYLTTQALHFCYGASIGLAAFWMEDVSGLYFIFDRVKWILGGFLMPIEVYPDAVRTVAEALPFRYMIAGPARLFVKFDASEAVRLVGSQAVWLAVLGLVCGGLYRLGVRRVDLNGG